MLFRVLNRQFLFPIFILALVFLFGAATPQEALAKVEVVSGSGMTEGDPGDGDETMGGGGSSGSFDPPTDVVTIISDPILFEFIFVQFGTERPVIIFPFGKYFWASKWEIPNEIIRFGGK